MKQIRNKVLKNLWKYSWMISISIIFFVLGNFFTLLTIPVDSSVCNAEICRQQMKQNYFENSLDENVQWQKNHQAKEKVVLLVILILSAPNNIEQREVIRQTWLTDEISDTMHYFVVGTSNLPSDTNVTIQSEQKKFGDLLLLENIQDSYKVLTKKILYSFVYLNNNVRFRYLLKVDDDTYVNLPKVHIELKEANFKLKLYWGFFDGRATPKKNGPWKETDWVLCNHYLPYALGGGYVLSSDLVSYISFNANLFKLYNSEDISVGVWLSPLQLHRVHDPRFDTEYASRGCSNQYIVSHKQSVVLMRDKYHSLKNTGVLCTKELKLRKSYIYNWNYPPSKCCFRNDSTIP